MVYLIFMFLLLVLLFIFLLISKKITYFSVLERPRKASPFETPI